MVVSWVRNKDYKVNSQSWNFLPSRDKSKLQNPFNTRQRKITIKIRANYHYARHVLAGSFSLNGIFNWLSTRCIQIIAPKSFFLPPVTRTCGHVVGGVGGGSRGLFSSLGSARSIITNDLMQRSRVQFPGRNVIIA